MRGRIRQLLVLVVLATIVLVSYKAVMDNTPSKSRMTSGMTYKNQRKKGPKMVEDVNALMPITQPQEHLDRMREHEKKMMDNVQKMIRHREEEVKLAGSGAAAKTLSKPSLWSGLERSRHQMDSGESPPKHVLPKRFVHLDLKGAPPAMKYIRTLFPYLKSLGVTGLLVEYEDMFPYWGRLNDVRAHNSYTVEDIKGINNLAAENKLEVVPLIQTFGHMEFILKRDGFKSLREVPALPQAICPSNNRTLALIYEMVDQVIILHPSVRYLHIGCDEVYNIGECPLCQERMDRMRWSTADLLLSHVKTIGKYVKEKHHVTAIVWDDMFRKIPIDVIQESKIGQFADILVWYYQNDFGEALTSDMWQKYAECFHGIWIASAFKGASGPASFATPIAQRLENHVGWMNVVEKYHSSVPFDGIFLTGWQRFDHFATLCELLPSSIPSLAVNLRYLQSLKWNASDEAHVQNALGCYLPVSLTLEANVPENRCNFPGSRVYELAMQFYTLVDNLNTQFFDSSYIKGWVSDYNLQTSFSSPGLLEQAMMRYTEGYRNLTFFQISMKEALSEAFDEYTVNEWLESNVRPLMVRLDNYSDKIKALLVPNTWPRRPVTPGQPGNTAPGNMEKKRLSFQHASEP